MRERLQIQKEEANLFQKQKTFRKPLRRDQLVGKNSFGCTIQHATNISTSMKFLPMLLLAFIMVVKVSLPPMNSRVWAKIVSPGLIQMTSSVA